MTPVRAIHWNDPAVCSHPDTHYYFFFSYSLLVMWLGNKTGEARLKWSRHVQSRQIISDKSPCTRLGRNTLPRLYEKYVGKKSATINRAYREKEYANEAVHECI